MASGSKCSWCNVCASAALLQCRRNAQMHCVSCLFCLVSTQVEHSSIAIGVSGGNELASSFQFRLPTCQASDAVLLFGSLLHTHSSFVQLCRAWHKCGWAVAAAQSSSGLAAGVYHQVWGQLQDIYGKPQHLNLD